MIDESNPKLTTAALTIAGSDSCGGAGIQADLRTFHTLGVHGASVVTAVTAQNTLKVSATQPISAAVIVAQLEAVLDDLPIRAIKTGMLPDAAAIESVSEIFQSRCSNVPLIVDPVLIATSGASLTVEDTISALRDHLFPLASLITPNLAEAAALSASEDPIEGARGLLDTGCGGVLLKGGHGEADTIVDRLITAQGMARFEHANQPGEYHGTGCTLSAAIAARMALGASLFEAVEFGIEHVQGAIAEARLPLKGNLHLLP